MENIISIYTKIKSYLKNMKTKNIVIVSGILLLVIGGIVRNRYNAYQADLQTKKEMMYTVTTGDIQVQVKVNAKASLVNEQNLSFGQEGKITSVHVHVGDEVKAGDVLAELDLKDYENAIKAAQLELENAQFGLSKLLNNDTSLAQARVRSQIKEAELALAAESDQYTILKKQLETALQQKRDQLQQVNREYELAKKEIDIAGTGLATTDGGSHAAGMDQSTQDRQQKIDAIVSDLNSIVGDMETTVKDIDRTLGITDAYRYQVDVYHTYISAHNVDLRDRIEKNTNAGYSLMTNFEPKIAAITSADSDNEIYTTIKNFYNESLVLITLCNNALDATEMPLSDLQGLATTISSYRSTVVGLRSQLKTIRDSVYSILSSYETHQAALESQSDTIDVLTKEIAAMEKDNQNQLQRKQAQITNLNEQISVLNEELSHVRQGVNAYDIKQQRNLISQAELKVERTKNQQDDYQILAEFDGRVRTVDIVEGEQYKLDDRKYIVVENPNLIELKLQVSQVDIVKIKEGQEVLVTFDAYPYTPIQATITSRDVNPEKNEKGGTYYTAKIVLEKQELEILAGMSALVTVKTAEAKDAIIVPTLSLVYQDGTSYVYLREGNTYVLHEVEIGVTNNFEAQILSGLQAGDVILASVLDEAMLEKMGISDGGLSSISFEF